jgi:membrane associated rhomboid family serine protease
MTGKRRRVSAVDVLIAINAAIFVYQWLRPDLRDHLQDLYALSAAGMEEGRWWQLITHAFLHGNIWHLLFNMIALWFAGRIVERVMGTGRFVALYAASAVAGGLAQLLLEGGTIPLLGASGAVFGVILAFTTMFPEAQIVALLFFVIPLKFRAKYLGWGLAGSSFLFLLFGFEPWIAHAAHLGGCAAGYLLARLNGYGVPTAPERLLKKWLSSRAA